MDFSPLTLGTVQLGMPYGIANRTGMPSLAATRTILDAAWAGGITCFDTARAYGEAEVRIGAWCAATGHRPALVSKVAALMPDGDAAAAVRAAVDGSCAALGQDRLAAMLLHRAADLDRPGAVAALCDLVAAGRIGTFGLSVYTVAEARAALAVAGLGVLQLPMSILDWRAADSGIVAEAAARGIAVFARSIYCQGLLFLDPAALPAHVAGAGPALRRLAALAADAGLDLAALALAGVRTVPGLASVIVGAESVEQVGAAVAAAARPPLDAGLVRAVRDAVAGIAPDAVDPRTWPR